MHLQGKGWYMGPAERAQDTAEGRRHKYIYNVNNTLHMQTTESGGIKTHSRRFTTVNTLINQSTTVINVNRMTYQSYKVTRVTAPDYIKYLDNSYIEQQHKNRYRKRQKLDIKIKQRTQYAWRSCRGQGTHGRGESWYMGPAERAQGTVQRVKSYMYNYKVQTTLHMQMTRSGGIKTHSRRFSRVNTHINYSTTVIKVNYMTYH